MSDLPLLLETIRLQDGQLPYLTYHQARLDQTQLALLGRVGGISLEDSFVIPEDKETGCYKVRLLYREEIETIEIIPYSVRPIHALQLVEINQLHYPYKYADRTAIQKLFSERTYGDDILMIREGLLTDTSYANVALFDGNLWYTPAKPLLNGTARARLLEEQIIHTADIHWQDLPNFQEIRLMNAMLDWEEGPQVAIEKVRWK